MFKRCFVGAILLVMSLTAMADGGVVVGATRVIYDANKKEASMTVANRNDAMEYLVQSWVENAKGDKVSDFMVTPPLFKLEPKKENILRIVRVGGDIPADRESVYWLNVKAIPPAPGEDATNVLQLAIKTRMKLFYRPAGLPGKASDSPAALVWKREGEKLKVTNPTPYSVVLTDVSVDGKPIKEADLVLGKGEVLLNMPAESSLGGSVAYRAINDYGGQTEVLNAVVH